MKSPHDTSDFDILLDPSLNKQGAEELGATLLGEQELRRILKLGMDTNALLIKLDELAKLRGAEQLWLQIPFVAALRTFARAQVGPGPITEVLNRLFLDLLDKTREGKVRTGAAKWQDRAHCIWALVALEEFMDPTEALNHLLSKKKVVDLIGAYQKRDGEPVAYHGKTVKKWRTKLEEGKTGQPIINELYPVIVVDIRERMENLTRPEIQRWADGLLARLP